MLLLSCNLCHVQFCQATMLFTLDLTGRSQLQGRSLTHSEVLQVCFDIVETSSTAAGHKLCRRVIGVHA